jgi:hypothetical protein
MENLQKVKVVCFISFLQGIKREIKIPNIEPVVLKALLNFIYTATLEVDEAILVPLIIATDQYQIKGAKEELEKAAHFFISKASKDPQSISKVNLFQFVAL